MKFPIVLDNVNSLLVVRSILHFNNEIPNWDLVLDNVNSLLVVRSILHFTKLVIFVVIW